MSEQPNKYYSLEIEKVIKELEDIINNSPLPYSILLLIITNFSKEIYAWAEKEREMDFQKYQEELKKSEKENSSEEENK